VNDQTGNTRLRYTATGAIAALAAVGAIAGTGALAAKSHPDTHNHTSMASGSTKTLISPALAKTHTSQPGSDRPFLNAAQRLVNDGTITAAEGQVLDGAIRAGTIDPDTLASSGFTQNQIQAVEQALVDAKRALAPRVIGGPPAGKEPTGTASKSPST
jgi:hypothetical protein